jgi:Zn finger protein HypA/HybF involved in hydrogenase expression
MLAKYNTEIFAETCSKLHNNYYDYSKTVYKNVKEKVTITCPVHGDFEQTPDGHLSGRGCPACGKKKISEAMTKRQSKLKVSLEEFKERAFAVHGNKYDYSNVSFNLTKDKIQIGCSVHGEFTQEVTKHLLGCGCPSCAHSKVKNGWTTEVWAEMAAKSKNFAGFRLYVVKCTSDTEEFYKIGKTYRDPLMRFRSIPYKIEVIHQVISTAEYISELEKQLQSINKHNKYTPSTSFFGKEECFSEIVFKENNNGS